MQREFEISSEVSKLVLELSDKTKQLGAAMQADASMHEEIVNVDLTDDLRKKMEDSDNMSSQLIDDIGNLQNKIKKLDKRF